MSQSHNHAHGEQGDLRIAFFLNLGFTLLEALVTTIILVVGSLYSLTEAGLRLLDPEIPNASGMALIAMFGIAVNSYAGLHMSGGESMKCVSYGTALVGRHVGLGGRIDCRRCAPLCGTAGFGSAAFNRDHALCAL